MKKLSLCPAAVTAIFASQANAGPGDVQLVGFVSPTCEVQGLATQLLDFGNVTNPGQNVSIGMFFLCNDVDGATVTLTSAEGGLESDDAEDVALAYDATFNPAGLGSFTMNAPGGFATNNFSQSNSYPGSSLLAGGVPATLSVTTVGSSIWAGGYSDTLTVNVTSN